MRRNWTKIFVYFPIAVIAEVFKDRYEDRCRKWAKDQGQYSWDDTERVYLSVDYIRDSPIWDLKSVDRAKGVIARGFRAANVQPLHVPPSFTTEAWKAAVVPSQKRQFERLELVDWRNAEDTNAMEQSTQANRPKAVPKGKRGKGVEVAIPKKRPEKRKLSEALIIPSDDEDEDEEEEEDDEDDDLPHPLTPVNQGKQIFINLDDFGRDIDLDAEETGEDDDVFEPEDS